MNVLARASNSGSRPVPLLRRQPSSEARAGLCRTCDESVTSAARGAQATGKTTSARRPPFESSASVPPSSSRTSARTIESPVPETGSPVDPGAVVGDREHDLAVRAARARPAPTGRRARARSGAARRRRARARSPGPRPARPARAPPRPSCARRAPGRASRAAGRAARRARRPRRAARSAPRARPRSRGSG